MDVSAVRPSWIAAAGLAVLTSASVAAVTMSATVAAAPIPAAPAVVRVVGTDAVAPSPVSLSFPAPVAPAPTAAAAAPAAPRAATARPPAPAPDTRCSGDAWQARRGAAAIATLRRPADARAVRVDFRPARAEVLGLAHLDERRVEVFVRSCSREPDTLLRHVLAHELGHVLDATRMTGASRAEWMRLRGIPAGTPWFGCSGCADFATPAGDFAEVYAQWQRRASSNRSQLAGAPSRSELARLAERFFAPL